MSHFLSRKRKFYNTINNTVIRITMGRESMQTDTFQTTTYSKQNTFQAGER